MQIPPDVALTIVTDLLEQSKDLTDDEAARRLTAGGVAPDAADLIIRCRRTPAVLVDAIYDERSPVNLATNLQALVG